MATKDGGIFAAVATGHTKEEKKTIALLLTTDHHSFPTTNVPEVAQTDARGLDVAIADESWKASVTGVSVFGSTSLDVI